MGALTGLFPVINFFLWVNFSSEFKAPLLSMEVRDDRDVLKEVL